MRATSARGKSTSGLEADNERPGSFLSELSETARGRLLAGAIRSNVAAGGMVYEGDAPPRVIVVERGLLRVFLSALDGRQVTARYIRRGDVAGLPLVVGGPAPIGIQAMTGALVASLRVDALRAMLATDPTVARACAKELARQLYETFDELSGQAFLSVRQRIAFHLLNMTDPTRRPPLLVHAAHGELADAVATTREAVTRNLHRLRDDGLVALSRDEIELLDPIGLAREAHRPVGRGFARRYRRRNGGAPGS